MVVTPRVVFLGKVYVFHRYLGLLLCYENYQNVDNQHTEDYSFVQNPYLLKKRTVETTIPTPTTIVKLYARLLVFLCKYGYPLLSFIPYLICPIYQDAGKANAVFYKLFPEKKQREYCLARALFTASLSKRFKKNGTIFIGAFLPTRHMHSWVIEDGMLADIYDKQWIQYTPVMEWQWGKR